METNMRISITPRALPVGTLVLLKAVYQHWVPGSIGLCFDLTEFLGKAGIFVIFEDGDCALFNVFNIPAYFEVIGFSTAHCFYRHQNYRQLKRDFEQGYFSSAFVLGRSLTRIQDAA